jgi:hypothetical protein
LLADGGSVTAGRGDFPAKEEGFSLRQASERTRRTLFPKVSPRPLRLRRLCAQLTGPPKLFGDDLYRAAKTDAGSRNDPRGQHAPEVLDHHLVVVDQHDAHKGPVMSNTFGPA